MSDVESVWRQQQTSSLESKKRFASLSAAPGDSRMSLDKAELCDSLLTWVSLILGAFISEGLAANR